MFLQPRWAAALVLVCNITGEAFSQGPADKLIEVRATAPFYFTRTNQIARAEIPIKPPFSSAKKEAAAEPTGVELPGSSLPESPPTDQAEAKTGAVAGEPAPAGEDLTPPGEARTPEGEDLPADGEGPLPATATTDSSRVADATEASDLVKKISLIPIQVTHDNVDDAGLTKACKVKILMPADGLPWRLAVELDLTNVDRGKLYGAYSATLEVQVDGKPVHDLSLALKYPETKLVPPSEIYVEQTRWFGQDRPPSSELRRLYLRVREGPPPADLSITQIDNATMGGHPVNGNLKVEPQPIPPIKPALLPVSVETPFPPGDATGKLLIVSPDMAPVEVSFKVRTRWHVAAIFFLALAGLLAGFLIRVLLQNYIEAKQMWLKFDALYHRAQRHTAKKAADFEKELAGVSSEIVVARRQTAYTFQKASLDKLSADFTQLQERLEAAVTRFEQKRTTLLGQLNPALALTEVTSVPRPLRSALAEAKTRLDAIATAISGGDLTRATNELPGEIKKLSRQCCQTNRKWGEALLRESDDLANIPGLPQGVAEKIAPVSEKLRTQVEGSPAETKDDLESAKAALEASHQAQSHATDLVRIIKAAVIQSATRVHELLVPVMETLPDAQAVNRLEQAIGRLEPLDVLAEVDRLDSPYASPTALDHLRTGFQNALNDAATAITSQLDAAPDQLKAAQALLQTGQYAAAARQAIDATLAVEVELEGVVGEADLAETLTLPEPGAATPLHIVEDTPLQRLLVASDQLSLDARRTILQLLFAQVVQFVLVAIGLALIAMVTFKGSFVGTLDDAVQILAWGFALDIGVNTFLDKAKGLSN